MKRKKKGATNAFTCILGKDFFLLAITYLIFIQDARKTANP